MFEGGFLGLDNIGVFDRSTLEGLPPGVRLEQADATAWMAMYCADMLSISLELAQANPSYEDIASKVRCARHCTACPPLHHHLAVGHARRLCDDGTHARPSPHPSLIDPSPPPPPPGSHAQFFEHFVTIAHSMNGGGASSGHTGLWDEEEGFFFDHVR